MAKVKKKEALSLEEKLERALVPVDEQLYEVPENWCWVKNNVFCQLGDGVKSEGSELPYLEVKYLRGVKEAEVVSKGKLIEAGTKVILVDGENSGEVFDILETGYMGSTFKTLIISSGVYDKYLLYFIHSKKDLLRNNKTGSAIPHLNKKLFFDLDFPLPPVAEQQRIVEQIENLFVKLDEVKDKLQEALDSYQRRKMSLLYKAYSGELTGGWRAANDIDLNSWSTVTINDISDVKGGKRVPKGMELVTENTGQPYIKAGNLKQGTVIDDGIMYVPDEVYKHIKNYTVKAGDVYITNVGACIGDCGVIPEKYDGANLTENAVKMTNLKCDSDFLALYLETSAVQQMIKGLIASATLGKLSIANIKTIEINLPSMDEQKEIVKIVKEVLTKEDITKEQIVKVVQRVELMKKSILAKVFRGELGTNNPDEESAVELLKSILVTN